jgi:LSD1 subclass zinc finger protein
MNMQGLKNKLSVFMQGRYGMDALYKALLFLLVVLLVLNLIIASPVPYFLSLACFFIMLWRVFSKNRVKRAEENKKYLALREKARKSLLQLRSRFRDRNTHRYRKCPGCRTTLRLQKKIGQNHVKCPVCSREFDVSVRF